MIKTIKEFFRPSLPIVGDLWELKEDDPFRPKLVIKILGVKKNWVQYQYIRQGSYSNLTAALPIRVFKSLFTQ